MELLRRAVDQAVQRNLIPPPQLARLTAGFQQWQAAGGPPVDLGQWLGELGLAPQEANQILLWRRSMMSSAGLGSSSTLTSFLKAGPLAKAENIRGAVFGPYVVEREIARGGMGVVFLARHGESGSPVALKTMLVGDEAKERDRKRFLREAEVAARMDHPGLVKVLDYGDADGMAYLALEFIDGPTLRDRLEDRLPPRRLAKTLVEVCRAVGHAHERGVVHRDLKPANILIRGQDDQIVVTDFGLVRDLELSSSLTKTGQSLGTPYYMAPEQVIGDPPSPATDVYALGVILYEGLVGQRPFADHSGFSLYDAIKKEDPEPPRQIDPGVPSGLEAICLMALSKAPEERYEDADAMADDLEAWLGGRLGTEGGRSGRAVPILVAGVAILAVVGGVVFTRGGDPKPELAGAESPAEPAKTVAPKTVAPEPEKTSGPPPKKTVTPKTRETPAPVRPKVDADRDRDARAIERADAEIREALRRGQARPTALAAAERAVRVAPFYGRALFVRGKLWARERKPQRALADLDRAEQAKRPYRDRELYLIRGQLLVGKRDYPRALPDLTKARAAFPYGPQIEMPYAMCLRGTRQPEAAAKVYRELIERGHTADWRVFYNLAGALRSAKKHAEAVPNYRKAIAMGARASWAYINCAHSLRDLKRYREADQLLASADPRARGPKFLILWSSVKADLKQWKEAHRLARRGLAGKDSAGAYYHLARALAGLGKRAEALATARKGARKYPQSAGLEQLIAEYSSGQ